MNDTLYSGINIDPVKKEHVLLHAVNKMFNASAMLLKIISTVESKELKKALEELKLNPLMLDGINQETELAYACVHFDMLSKIDPEVEQMAKDYIEAFRELNYDSYISNMLKQQLDPFAMKRIEIAYAKLQNCSDNFADFTNSGLFTEKDKTNDILMKLHKNQIDGTLQMKKYSEDLAKKIKEDADVGNKSKP